MKPTQRGLRYSCWIQRGQPSLSKQQETYFFLKFRPASRQTPPEGFVQQESSPHRRAVIFLEGHGSYSSRRTAVPQAVPVMLKDAAQSSQGHKVSSQMSKDWQDGWWAFEVQLDMEIDFLLEYWRHWQPINGQKFLILHSIQVLALVLSLTQVLEL